ncbi:hypothetical protein C8J56DRAFT_165094 [Mycena floridula]|nr:hypothetical protein C8J56DRAFT_165094 [Mycena floridula]
MADVDMPDATSEGDGNIISLQLESPPSLSFHEMRLADLRRFQIKPVSGVPLNQQAPGVYLHPTEADTIVTVSADPDILLTVSSESSSYMDELAAEEAAIEAEMAKFDEPTRKAMDFAADTYKEWILTEDAFPTSDEANERATIALQIAFQLHAEIPANTHVPIQRRGALALEHYKNELRPLVVDRYHLSPQAEQGAQSTVVTNLLQNSTFLNNDGELFRAPIVKEAFNMLDQKLRSESQPNTVYTRGEWTSCQSIALVATALECCLDEWKSGQRVDLAFNADSYAARYNAHLPIIRSLSEAETGRWLLVRPL